MRTSISLGFCCALLLASSSGIYGQDKVTDSTNKTTTQAPTTEATTTSTTTPKPTTTPKTTTTSTAAPTTTPHTTTTPVPTHAPPVPPTPAPKPEVGKWNVTQGNDTIVVQMAAQLVINYYNETGNLTEQTITIPSNINVTHAEGTFTPTDESIKLSWKSSGKEMNSIQFSFHHNNKTYSLNSVNVSIDPADLPHINSSAILKLVHKENHFNTSIEKSYKCLRLQTFNLTSESDNKVVSHLKVSDLRFQAFKKDKTNNFSEAEDCAFDTPDIVPIAVGCVLAGLVVIVLVVYLISRRRSQARGYLSM